LLWRQNNPEVNYSPLGSPEGGGVSRGSIQQQAIVRVIKSRRMRWAGHVARMGEERGGVQGLSGETGGKETTGRPRRRWVDN